MIALGLPIAFSMASIGFLGLIFIIGIDPSLAMAGQVFFDNGMNYTLSILPLFLLMGNFVVKAGLADELYSAANAWLRHKKGGLAMATIIACGGFSSVCGSSLATTATMAKIALPSMKKYDYPVLVLRSNLCRWMFRNFNTTIYDTCFIWNNYKPGYWPTFFSRLTARCTRYNRLYYSYMIYLYY